MVYDVLMAAADGYGGVYSMWDSKVEAPTLEEAFKVAVREVQDWTPEHGGFLLSRIGPEGTVTAMTGTLVIQDIQGRRCWLGDDKSTTLAYVHA